MFGDLGGRFFYAQGRAEINFEFECRFACLREGFNFNDCADANIDFFKVRESDLAAHPASSFERFAAAATAFSINGFKPSSAINTCNAACVVPFGEVTFSRKVAASMPD